MPPRKTPSEEYKQSALFLEYLKNKQYPHDNHTIITPPTPRQPQQPQQQPTSSDDKEDEHDNAEVTCNSDEDEDGEGQGEDVNDVGVQIHLMCGEVMGLENQIYFYKDEERRRYMDGSWGLVHLKLYRDDLQLAINKRHGEPYGMLKCERNKRLNENIRVLYHCTSEGAADDIKKEGKMRRGKTGMAGGGIYFALTEQDAARKALSSGYMLKCTVKLGNTKTIDMDGDPSIRFRKLLKEGYDSVCIPRINGQEYVVYNWDQVTVDQSYEYRSVTPAFRFANQFILNYLSQIIYKPPQVPFLLDLDLTPSGINSPYSPPSSP